MRMTLHSRKQWTSGLADDANDKAIEKAHDAYDSASDKADCAMNTASDMAADAKGKASEAYNFASQKVDDGMTVASQIEATPRGKCRINLATPMVSLLTKWVKPWTRLQTWKTRAKMAPMMLTSTHPIR
ncbi:hypothetical protein K7X08_005145 [Anisodus acutangulus]|uniref:Uncharacterized protein n=1 Tax=Anisodus acutangulus TaxID=402998 RepID=A0A9Q1MGF0_9SOLA|nr:hypothetical protein K7X08_005145 [Anisodus acutangulus]